MTFALIFLTIFIVGPFLFRLLTYRMPSARQLRLLALLTALTALAGLGLRFGLSDLWGEDLVVTGVGVALAWVGWIGILAYGAQALRRRDPGQGMRRWTAVLGAIGTTIPWFGLASAAIIAG